MSVDDDDDDVAWTALCLLSDENVRKNIADDTEVHLLCCL